MRHLGAAHTFPYVSYYQVLNGDPAIPPDYFANQIVVIGKDLRHSYIRTLVSGGKGTESGRSIETATNTGQYL